MCFNYISHLLSALFEYILGTIEWLYASDVHCLYSFLSLLSSLLSFFSSNIQIFFAIRLSQRACLTINNIQMRAVLCTYLLIVPPGRRETVEIGPTGGCPITSWILLVLTSDPSKLVKKFTEPCRSSGGDACVACCVHSRSPDPRSTLGS